MPVASIRTRTAGRRDEIGCSFDLADDGDGNLTAAINVIPPADSDGKGGRRPADIVCVVDTSGSMNSIAPAADGGEGDCLTRLDLVKHSLQTIIAVMKPQDRLGIVSFDTRASVVSKLCHVKGAKVDTLKEKVEQLSIGGCTQLWDGLRCGLEVMAAGREADDGRIRSVFLLTDGQPSDNDHMSKLEAYQRKNKGDNSIINTFGFTYSLNSALLESMACAGRGMYTFVPDSSFVGTAFVNNLANTLSTMAHRTTVSIDLSEGVTVADGTDATMWRRDGSNVAVDLGPIVYGQTRSAVLKLRAPCSADGEAVLLAATAQCDDSTAPTVPLVRAAEGASRARAEEYRLAFGAAVRRDMQMADTPPDASGYPWDAACRSLAAQIRADTDSMATIPAVAALLEDIEGQVCEALSKDEYFTKWGKHYLPSIARSHALQQCSNFKDPGLQVYGSDVFATIRDEADDIFVDLPPPTPTGYGRSASAAPVDMSAYYNASGGCFAGHCLVELADGTVKRVDALRKGDRVRGPRGRRPRTAVTRCVVRTRCAARFQDMVCLPGGLMITPFHPVRTADGTWSFPKDLVPVGLHDTNGWVYNFVLDAGHTVTIDGTEACTLGHGFSEPVVSHPFLGTDAVLKDLARLPGWTEGQVTLTPDSFRRAADSGMICSIAGQRYDWFHRRRYDLFHRRRVRDGRDGAPRGPVRKPGGHDGGGSHRRGGAEEEGEQRGQRVQNGITGGRSETGPRGALDGVRGGWRGTLR